MDAMRLVAAEGTGITLENNYFVFSYKGRRLHSTDDVPTETTRAQAIQCLIERSTSRRSYDLC
jgi:hypothetical protein